MDEHTEPQIINSPKIVRLVTEVETDPSSSSKTHPSFFYTKGPGEVKNKLTQTLLLCYRI